MSMELIETIELTSTQSSLTFSAIPQSYHDLVVLASPRSTESFDYSPLLYRINNSDTGYTGVDVVGNGSSIFSTTAATRTATIVGGTWGRLGDNGVSSANMSANSFSNVSMYFSDYTSSNKKALLVDYVNANQGNPASMELVTQLHSGTSAITQLDFALGNGLYTSGTTFSIYGISNA